MYGDAVRIHLGETGLLEIEQSGQELPRERVPIEHAGGGGGSSDRRLDRSRVVDQAPELEVEARSPAPHYLAHRLGDLRDDEGFLSRDLPHATERSARACFALLSRGPPGSGQQRPRRTGREGGRDSGERTSAIDSGRSVGDRPFIAVAHDLAPATVIPATRSSRSGSRRAMDGRSLRGRSQTPPRSPKTHERLPFSDGC